MIRDLLPLFLALALAVVIYAGRQRRRRRAEIRPQRPDLTMSEAWRIWWAGAWASPDQRLIPLGLQLDRLAPELSKKTLQTLLELEKVSTTRRSIRRAILDNATTALHLEFFLQLDEAGRKFLLSNYGAELSPALQDAWRTGVLRWIVLRLYAALKYDDAFADDWFHHFMQIARPYIREKIRAAREAAFQLEEHAGTVVQIYDALLDGLQRESLKAPPKKRFVPENLPGDGS